jgi:deoxyribose-phosphate aldolase
MTKKITCSDVERAIDASIGAAPAPTIEQVKDFVKSTIPYNFAAVAIEPFYTQYVSPMYHEAGKKICVVSNYPLGGMTCEAKLDQIKRAIKDGADEIDCGIDISAFMSGNYKKVADDFKRVMDIVEGRIVKYLYFASLMTEYQQLKAVEIAVSLGVPFLKTNPGYGFSTSLDNVRLIKENFGDAIKIMTSGGVRTTEQAIAMMEAGATRIATSSAFKIMDGFDTN